jgi:hypothetical protein
MRRGWLIPLGLFVAVTGCAGTKPCMVIPAQIELARDVRDAAMATRDEKKAEMDRWVDNVKQSRTKLERLTEERDQLKKEISGGPTAKQVPPKKEGEAKK